MIKYLLMAVALFSFSAPALADGYDLTVKSIDELDAITSNNLTSSDFIPVYDASVDKFKKVTATSVGDGLNYETVTAANTILASECGKRFFINSATGFASTLPAPTAGCEFEFVLMLDSAAAYHTIITTGSETIKGLGFESETDTGDDGPTTQAADTISFISASAVPSDRVSIISDGTSWHAISFTAADGGITYSSAI